MLPYLVVVMLIKSACGDLDFQLPSLGERIVGGISADIEDFPYQLALEYRQQHIGGAALIRQNVAITAAHCTVGERAPYLNVRAGSSLVSEGGQVVGVSHICDHPKFDRETYDYDVSVLILKKSLSLNGAVQIIRIQPVSTEVPNGYAGTVTGWGRLFYNGSLPRILQAVRVPKMDDDVCAVYLEEADVTDRMICFGYKNGQKDACQGDSGGPLVVNGRLVGLVSWGDKCAWPERPGVYTKLSHPGIRSHVDQCIEKHARGL